MRCDKSGAAPPGQAGQSLARKTWLKGRYSNRLDRIPCKLDPLLAAKHPQQHQNPLVRFQESEHSNLIDQRAVDHAHLRARSQPARPRQVD
jgi:hypothetical protein